jgi:hypothetical protein
MPLRHTGQVLSLYRNPPTTKSPGVTVVTAAPTSSTIPTYSCPIGVGLRPPEVARYGQRSDPHTHTATVRMTASVGSMMVGSARSSKRTSPGP